MLYAIVLIIAALGMGTFCIRRENRKRSTLWPQNANKMNSDRDRAITTVSSLHSIEMDLGPDADLTQLWLDRRFALPPGFTSNDLLLGARGLAAKITRRYNLDYKPVPVAI